MIGALLGALLAIASPALAQNEYDSACFMGLNDADSPATLNNCESPDLLNTESNLQGTAILKRKGYQKTQDLTVSTAPVTGSHSFIDTAGNRQDIVCYDRYCAHSVNGNAFADFLTTATAGITRWSWVDVGGVAYGANNKYDHILKYDGTTASYPATMPQGTILELAQSRLVVGDILNNPNRVYYSSAGAYEQFTIGANSQDAYFDDLGAPGDKVRGLKYINGNLYIFKSASLTLCELGDQYSSRCSILSPNVGTTDPASIIAAGDYLYFRAQDKNYWEISSSGMRQISKKIPNLVKSQSGGLGGGEHSNTQTTQADWQAGTQSPTGTWDTTTINGSIFPSSVTFVDYSSSNWLAGTFAGTAFQSASPYNLVTAGVPFAPFDAQVTGANTPDNFSPAWSKSQSGSPTITANGSTLVLSVPGGSPCPGNSIKYTTPISGPIAKHHVIAVNANATGSSLNNFYLGFYDSSAAQIRSGIGPGNIIIVSTASAGSSALSPTYSTFTVVITTYGAGEVWKDGVFQSSGSYQGTIDSLIIGLSEKANLISGNCSASTLGITFFNYSANAGDPGTTSNIPTDVSTFTSRILNTGYSAATGGPFVFNGTLSLGTTTAFSIRSSTSPNNDLWTSWTSISSGTRISESRQYQQYRAVFSPVSLSTGSRISDVNLPYASTGTFHTQCIQPGTSISAWGSLSCAQTLSGNGSIVFYATSAATCAALPASAPTSWNTSVSNNATLSIATNTAVYIGWRSLLTSATDQAQIDSCILNWNEGTLTQPSWAAYDSVKNSVYWTATINNATTANRLLKYDRNLEQWYPFDIPAQAPLMINNSLYFGGASAGTWNLYGSVDSDNGSAINAYWKSKDIGSGSPFSEKTFKTLSILSRNNGTGNMTGTWTLSNSQTGSYTISLSTGTGIRYARSNYNLPFASPQQFLNVKIGNNSSTPFEVLGLGVTWITQPWRVSGP